MDQFDKFQEELTQNQESLDYNYLRNEIKQKFGIELLNFGKNVDSHKDCLKVFQESFLKMQSLNEDKKTSNKKIEQMRYELSQNKKEIDELKIQNESLRESERKLSEQVRKSNDENQKIIKKLEGQIKESQVTLKKLEKEKNKLKDQYLKKALTKTNNFELSKLMEKKSTNFQKNQNFSKEDLFKQSNEKLINQMTNKFREIFNLNKGIFETFQNYLYQRKGYLMEKMRSNEIDYEGDVLEEYDQLKENIKEINIESIDVTDIFEMKQKYELFFKFTTQFESFLNKDFSDFIQDNKQPKFFDKKDLSSKKFVQIKKVRELQFLLESYNDLAEKQKILNHNQQLLIGVEGTNSKVPNRNLLLVERLKKNIENLDIFIEKQTQIFKEQQFKFKENEENLKSVQNNLESIINN